MNLGTYLEGYILDPISVTSDATPPAAPQTVSVDQLPNTSILRVTWEYPDSGDADRFEVYRTIVNPVGATGVDPSWDRIGEALITSPNTVVDSKPVSSEAWYVVVAVDAVGNRSLADTFPSINLGLVAPSEVTIYVEEGSFPVLSWSAVDEVSNGGTYSVYHGNAGSEVPLATGLTETTFTDTTWDGKTREYWVESVKDGFLPAGILFLPEDFLESDVAPETVLSRGMPGSISAIQRDFGPSGSFQMSIATVAENPEIIAGGNNQPSVDFGLQASTTNTSQAVRLQFELAYTGFQDIGETVVLARECTLPVEDRFPAMELAVESLPRGALVSSIDLTVINPSESDIKIDFSQGHVALKLYDTAGTLLSQNVLTDQADRTVLGGESATLYNLEIEVPVNAPDTVILQTELYQYRSPQTGQIFASEGSITSRLSMSTVPISYRAEITAPQTTDDVSISTGELVEITGRVVDSNGVPKSAALVTLELVNGDYKRSYALLSDSQGAFYYTFAPDESVPSGEFTIIARHPELAREPSEPEAYGSFKYARLAVTPKVVNVRMPRNYSQGVPFKVSWSDTVDLTNLTVEALSFGGDVLPPGIAVELPQVIDPEVGTTSLDLMPRVLSEIAEGAPDEVVLLFRVSARINGSVDPVVLGEVTANCFFTQQFGQLTGPSRTIDLAVLREDSEDGSETITDDLATVTFTNTGLIPLTGLRFDVAQSIWNDNSVAGYEPAPDWLELVGSVPEVLAVGETVSLQLATNLANEAVLPANGVYKDYVVRAQSTEASDAFAYLDVTVTTDSNSTLEVHVVNAYFGFDASTLPDGGEGFSISTETLETYESGVPGATVTLQQDALASSSSWVLPLIYKGVTGSDGKVSSWTSQTDRSTSTSIPAGRYQMTVKAPKHDSYTQVLVVKPSVAGFEQIPLAFGAVTVEWAVREITLQDRYEVIIETTFETEVPAPIITIEPSYTSLPAMCPGDVFEVELFFENKGIITALNLENPIPDSDEFLRIEPLVNLGDTFDLLAGQTLRVAFRCIAIKALPGASCESGSSPSRPLPGSYSNCKTSTYDYICPWDSSLNYSSSVSNCIGFGGSWKNNNPFELGGGSTSSSDNGIGGGIDRGRTRRAGNAAECAPPPPPDDPCAPHVLDALPDSCREAVQAACDAPADGGGEYTGSQVDLWGLRYYDAYRDLGLAVPGGWLSVNRRYANGSWRMDGTEIIIPISTDAEGRARVSLSGRIFTKTDDRLPDDFNGIIIDVDDDSDWRPLKGTFISEDGYVLQYTYYHKVQQGYPWYRNEMLITKPDGSWLFFNGDPTFGGILAAIGDKGQTHLVYDRDLAALKPESPFEDTFPIKRVLSGIGKDRSDLSLPPDPVSSGTGFVKGASRLPIDRLLFGNEPEEVESRVLLYYNYGDPYEHGTDSWPMLESVTTYDISTVTSPDPDQGKIGVFYEYYRGFEGDPDTGLLKSVLHTDGTRSFYTYDSDRNLATKTEYAADGTTILKRSSIEYQSSSLTAEDAVRGNLIVGALGGPPKPVASVTDGSGITKRFSGSYNETSGGYYSKVTYSNGSVREVWFDDESEVVQTSIDGQMIQNVSQVGRVERVTTRGNSITLREYDEFDNLIRETLPTGHVRSWAYETYTEELISQREDSLLESTLSVESTRMVSMTDENGTEMNYTYADADWGIDGNGVAYSTAPYYATSSIKITQSGDDLSRTGWEYYDDLDRLVLEIDYLGHQAAYRYIDQKTLIKEAYRPDVIDPESGLPFVIYSQTFDAFGYVDTYTDAAGSVTDYDYSPDGQLLRETDPLGVSDVYTYLGDDLIEQETGRIGNPGDADYQRGRILRYSYDGDGRILTEKRVDDEAVEHLYMTYVYDSMGQLASVINADSLTTTFTYDSYGNRTSTSLPLPEARDESITETHSIKRAEWNVYGDLLNNINPVGWSLLTLMISLVVY